MPNGELIFVYNVDATPTALLRDLYLSVTTGSTDCQLCDLTFGKVLKNPEWAAFVRGLPVPVRFHLRSTVVRMYPELRGHTFPAAFYRQDGAAMREVLSAAQIDRTENLEELRALVTECVDGLADGEQVAAASTTAAT